VDTFKSKSPAETEHVGIEIAQRLDVGKCLALNGPLGAGKTVLTRGIARGMGLTDPRLVSSPSYVLVQEYPADKIVYHVDLYRLPEASAEISDLGLDEMLADGVVVIEWAQRAADRLPIPHWQANIEITGASTRLISFQEITGR